MAILLVILITDNDYGDTDTDTGDTDTDTGDSGDTDTDNGDSGDTGDTTDTGDECNLYNLCVQRSLPCGRLRQKRLLVLNSYAESNT